MRKINCRNLQMKNSLLNPSRVKLISTVSCFILFLAFITADCSANGIKSNIKQKGNKIIFHKNTAKIYTKGIVIEMVKIPAGSFVVSGRKGKTAFSYKVTLTKDYWMGKFEVTQAQYNAVLGINPSLFKGDNRPVEHVTWKCAKDFCDKLNEYYSDQLPEGYKFDLPTEAQWEYAARGAKQSRSYKYSGSSNIDEVGWHSGNSGYTTHVVGGKKPNESGLYDMSGNVGEWCRDWYDDYQGDTVDPAGPENGTYRIARGGGWGDDSNSCIPSCRYINSPDIRFGDIGFRIAVVPKQ